MTFSKSSTLLSLPSPKWWRRLWYLVVPPMPDFYGMLDAQIDNLQETVSVLDNYLQESDEILAAKVNDQVEQGHLLRDKTLSALYASFITPVDREDIYTLSMSFDHILDYLKNTVREVEILKVQPDDWMQRMTADLSKGVSSLALGLARFRAGQAEDVTHTVRTREAERDIEDLYREALENMFQGEQYLKLTVPGQTPDVLSVLDYVINSIKRREVYRHLSNAADRLAHAGEALRDISIKYDSGKRR
jgi:uncharacterized protein Yka (UPF0111/DUF47 family)